MTRKAIPQATQEAILLKSRRRCCLCFWLAGEDVVKKGQIAHLDQNNENATESNLAFLCLEHHDQFDSTTSVTKNFTEGEIRKWRDELYKELEYRFRDVRKRSCELSIRGFQWYGVGNFFGIRFFLKNTGDIEVKHPILVIRLPNNVKVEKPRRSRERIGGIYVDAIMPELFGFSADRQDLFEPGGRVAIFEQHPMHRTLMPGHGEEAEGLCMRLEDYPIGSDVSFEYRIDAEQMVPVVSQVTATVPSNIMELLTRRYFKAIYPSCSIRSRISSKCRGGR